MINFVPQATGLKADGSPDSALLQALAARRKAQEGGGFGQRLSQAAASPEPVYSPALGYAKMAAGALGGYLEGREKRAKVEQAGIGAQNAAGLAQSLGLSESQAAQLKGLYLSNPEAASALVKQMSERLFAKPADRYVDEKMPGGGVAQRNATTNELAVRIQPDKPQFGDIGTDPQNGASQKGWIDPNARTVTPVAPQGAPQGASVVPPVPPGVNPKIWNDEQSKRAATQGLPAAPDDVANLRKEVQNLPSYKNLSQAAPIYTAMADAASKNTKASDLNLVYGLGKIMDPGSVVREGEMLMVKNTSGLTEGIMGAINSLNGGAALTPDTRIALMREAKGRLDAYKQSFDQDVQQYQGIVERNRMNPADVIPQFPQATEFERAGPPVPPDLQQQIAASRAAGPEAAAAPAPQAQAAPQGLSIDMIEAEIMRRQQQQQQAQPQQYVDPMGGRY